MALPVTRTFSGVTGAIPTADETAWAYNRNNSNNWQVVTGGIIEVGDHSQDTCMHWTGDTFDDSHSSEVTISNIDSTAVGTGVGPAVRCATGSTAKTYVGLHCVAGGYELIRHNAGASSVITSGTGTTFANNDVVKLTVNGSTFKMYKNGVQFGGDQTNSDLSGGAPGISHSSTTTVSDSQITSWTGDNLTVAANTPSVNDTATITEDITVRAHLNVKMQKLGT